MANNEIFLIAKRKPHKQTHQARTMGTWAAGKKKPILGIFIRPLEDEVHLFGGLLFIYLFIIARSHFDSPITISFRKLEHSNMPKIALSQTLFA
jgi:hypothetical protein